MKKRIATLTFLIFTFHVFSQKDNALLIFVGHNYQIEYPKTWRLDTSKKMGTELCLFSPLENEADKLSENVNLIIQDLKGQNINLNTYKSITDKQLTEVATGCKVFESSVIKKENKEFYTVSYSMIRGVFKLRIISICFIKNEKAYLVTFTSEFTKYEQYKKVGEEILNSFKLTN